MVVVQHAEPVAVGDGGDEQIDGWKAVMSDSRELRLRVEGTFFHGVVELVVGE